MILELKNLEKRFPKVHAVRGVSFGVREGMCFGLLGPNGAGKTTTLEMIEGIQEPTSGEILFRGESLTGSRAALRRFRERAGIQFQSTALPDLLKVKEVLTLFGGMYPKSADVGELIRLCNLEEVLDRDAHKLSGGQRQRMLLAVSLIHDPDIVFLDEPTTGLDPQARRNFWELVRTIRARGKTIILTTHYMEEAHELCDEIAIMDHGKVIAQGSPTTLLHKHFDTRVVELPPEAMAGSDPAKFARAGKRQDREDRVEFLSEDVNGTLKALVDAGVSLAQVQVRSRTLDDLFLELTGKDLRT